MAIETYSFIRFTPNKSNSYLISHFGQLRVQIYLIRSEFNREKLVQRFDVTSAFVRLHENY